MKLLRLLLLFILMSSVGLAAFGQNTTYPYTEDFDALTPQNGSLSGCQTIDYLTGTWTNDGGNVWTPRSTSTGSGGTGPSGDHTGSGNYVFLESSSCYNNTIHLYSEAMNFTSLTSPRMIFYYHMYGSAMGSLDIYASIDGGSTWSASLWSLSGNQGNSWEEVILDLSTYTANNNVIIRFTGVTGSSFTSDMAIDDVTFEETPSCIIPNTLTATNLTATSADLGWTSGGSGETAWDIEYGATAFSQGTGTIISGTATNPHVLSGLTANTTYDFYVRADCGGGDYSAWAGPFDFTTLCSDYTAPYTQNFDGTTASALDACWSTINTTGSAYVYLQTTTLKANSTSNSLYFNNSSYTSGDLIAVSPMFTDFVANKRIKFHVYDDSDGSDLIVGTMSDPTDEATFTAFQTIAAADMDDDVWEQFTVNFTGYVGTDKYIAFKHSMTTTYDYLYVDDFLYEEVPACIEPSTLIASNISATTANLGWTSGGSGETAWEVAVQAQGTGIPAGSGTPTGMNPYTVTGLTAETDYEFYVRADCGGSGYSSWTGPFDFTTPCAANTTFPYTETFDALSPNNNSISVCQSIDALSGCWVNESTNTNMWVPRSSGTTSSATGPSADHTGSGNYIYIEASGCSNTSYVYSEPMDMTSLTVPRLIFWYHMYGSNIGSLSVEVSIDNGMTWSASIWSLSGDQGNNWLEATVDFPSYGGESSVLLRFSGTTAGIYSDIAIDDVTIEEAPTCLMPNTLTATNVTATSADLGWTSGGSGETAWDIEYGATSFTQGTGTMVSGITTNPYSLSGLTSVTDYDFYVRADCGGGDYSAWAGPYSFTTLISCPTPSAMAASNIMATGADLSWTVGDSETAWNIEWKAGATFTPENGEEDGSASPTMTATYSMSSLTEVTTYYIYYQADCGSSDYSDWVGPYSFTTPVSCPTPSALSASNITATSADLSWTIGGSETDWEIVVQADGTGTPAGSGTMISTNPYTVTGLMAQTDYEYYVRADCGSSDYSTWVGPFDFTTPCAAVTMFSQDFDAGSSIPDCWEAYDPSSGSSSSSTSQANSGSRSWRLYNGNNYDAGIISEEVTNLGSAYRLTFYAYADPFYSSSASETLRVGTVDAADNFTEFTTVTFAAIETWEKFSIDFSAYAGSDTRLMIEHGDGDAYQYIYIDDMVWEPLPSCIEPNSLAATNITATSADLAWMSGGSGETAWEIVVQAQGTGIPAGSGIAVSSNPYTTMSLTGQTDYEFYVRADCGGGDYSTWVGPYSFTTPCMANTSFPYTETFDALSPNNNSISGCQSIDALSGCWTNESTNQNMWTPRSSGTGSSNTGPSGDHTGSGNYIFLEASSCSNTSYVYSEVMDMTSLTVPRLIFWYHMYGSNIGSLSVEVSIDNGMTWSASVWSLSGDQGNNWLEAMVDLAAYGGESSVIIRFSGTTSGTYSDIAIDDVTIEETPAADAAIIDLILPTSSACLGGTEIVKVQVENMGANAIAIGDVSISLSGDITAGPISNTGTIAAGATEDIQFVVDLSTPQTYNITATLTMSGDGNAANDTDNGTVTTAAPDQSADYLEGFATTSPTGWTTTGWSYNTSYDNGHASGAYGIGKYFSSSYTSGSFMTAKVNGITSGDVFRFDYKIINAFDANTAIVAGWGNFIVEISDDCGETWTTELTVNDANHVVSTNWATMEIDLSAYAGRLIQVKVSARRTANTYYLVFDQFGFGNSAVLPVELTRFTAQEEGVINLLTWETASEENNAYFDVERSTNGVDFEIIGQVEGNGTTVEVSNYDFIDENPMIVSYYRLRQVDFDGAFEYSDVKVVKRENATRNSAVFYPVPVTDRLTIDFEATTNEDLNITVVDALGRQVITKVVRTVEGKNQFTLDFDTLPMGTYFVKLQSNDANVIRTIVKE